MSPIRGYFVRWLTALVFLSVCTNRGQGIQLTAGQSVTLQFDTMATGTWYPGGSNTREGYSFDGLFSPTPASTYAFRVDLFDPFSGGQPFNTINFPAYSPPPGVVASFGYAEWGSPWQRKRGEVRLTYLSGPPVTLVSLIPRQTLFEGNPTTSSFEIQLVPEPETWALLCGGLSVFALARLRRNCWSNRPARWS